MIFMAPLIILQLECASQKKQTYGVTNSMRSVMTPQGSQLPPVTPVYAKDLSGIPCHDVQTPNGTVAGRSPSPAANNDAKKRVETSAKERDAGITNGKEEGGGGVGGTRKGEEDEAGGVEGARERGEAAGIERQREEGTGAEGRREGEKEIMEQEGVEGRKEEGIGGEGEVRVKRGVGEGRRGGGVEERIKKEERGRGGRGRERGERGGNGSVGDEKGDEIGDGFNECPDLTPDILMNIINDSCYDGLKWHFRPV